MLKRIRTPYFDLNAFLAETISLVFPLRYIHLLIFKRIFMFYYLYPKKNPFLTWFGKIKLHSITAFSSLLMVLFFNVNNVSAQGPCPSSNCTSGDMTITKVELVAADGGVLPNTCIPGQQYVDVKLKVTFDATSKTRYGFLLVGDVYIDGSFAQKVWQCYGEDFTQGTHTKILDQVVSWPCGSSIELRDVYTGWDNQAPSTTICNYLNNQDGSITDCSAIDPKCRYYGATEAFVIALPLIANFTYSAECTGNSSFEQITFSSPASGTGSTMGGNKPYTYSWEIRDATDNSLLATSSSNPYVYQPSNNHDLLVKLTVTDASVPTAQTDDETKTVSVGLCCSPPTVNSQPSDLQKCEGSSASFSFTYSGGVPAPTIQWQLSTNNGSNWSDLSNSSPYSGVATSTLNISSVTTAMSGYQYRAVLQSGEEGTCDAAYTDAATLTVNPTSVGGTVASDQTICSGDQPSSALTLSGNTGSVVKWQKSTSSNFSSGVTDIANTSNTLFAAAIGALTQDTWFRAVVQSGVCDAANSNSVKITVQQPINNNNIAADQTICSGHAPDPLTGSTPAGGDGSYAYQWQSKTSGGWSDISGANDKDYAPGTINETTQFRRIVTAGSACSSSTSNMVTISISPESEVFSIQAGSYCVSAPNTGTITLGGSYPGVSYQLKNASDDSNVGSPVVGDGNPIVWDNLGEGTYYVFGTGIAPTYCTSQTANATVHEFDCSAFYTLTQGYYGGKNGKSCRGDMPVQTILYLLASGDIVVGSINSVTVPATPQGALRLNQTLPGGGTPTALPPGNCIITTACFVAPTYLTKQGRINNILLAQTLTLSLNVRWNDGELLLFPIRSGYLTTQKLQGCDKNSLPVEDCDANTIKSIKMNQNVVDYLGGTGTVADLLQLANDVLGGSKTPGVNGVPSFADVNDAVSAINNAFDEGRRFLDYFDDPQSCETLFPEPIMPAVDLVTNSTTGTATSINTESPLTLSSVTVKAYPNPYTDKVNFAVDSKVSGQGSLEVFNMVGQKIKTVYEGFITAGRRQFVLEVPLQQRAYLIYIFKVGDQMVSGKLLQMSKR